MGPFACPDILPMANSWKEFKSEVDPIGVLGLLLCCSFFLASMVALSSHCDSAAPVSSLPTAMSGKSIGTFDELMSLLRRRRRSDNRFDFGDLVFEFSLACDLKDATDACDELRTRPLKKRLVSFSVGMSAKDGGPDDSVDENVGGSMISCVCVSDLMKVKTGTSSSCKSGWALGTGASLSAALSFFLRISLRGMMFS
jgi:hypothetical protein